MSSLYEAIANFRKSEGKYSTTLDVDGVRISAKIHIQREIIFSTANEVSAFFGTMVDDDAMQVIVCNNLKINKEVVLTPPKRCRGLTIFVWEEFINQGKVSMSTKGAASPGQNILLFKDGSKIYKVPAVGASGAQAHQRSAAWAWTGSNGVDGQTGGGGQGGMGGNGPHRFYYGTGSAGTSYAGGSGSGGCQWAYNSTNGAGVKWMDSANGTQGGLGWAWATSSQRAVGLPGLGVTQANGATTKSSSLSKGNIINPYGNSGPGGLINIFARTLDNQGIIEASGGIVQVSWRYSDTMKISTGGGTGGGSINVFARVLKNKGTLKAEPGYYNNTYDWRGKHGANSYVENGSKGGYGTTRALQCNIFLYNYLIKQKEDVLVE